VEVLEGKVVAGCWMRCEVAGWCVGAILVASALCFWHVALWREIQDHTGICMMILHHLGKSRKARDAYTIMILVYMSADCMRRLPSSGAMSLTLW